MSLETAAAATRGAMNSRKPTCRRGQVQRLVRPLPAYSGQTRLRRWATSCGHGTLIPVQSKAGEPFCQAPRHDAALRGIVTPINHLANAPAIPGGQVQALHVPVVLGQGNPFGVPPVRPDRSTRIARYPRERALIEQL